MRGAIDFGGVVNRMAKRSKYGGMLLYLVLQVYLSHPLYSKDAQEVEQHLELIISYKINTMLACPP